MKRASRPARINVKALVILALVIGLLGGSAAVAYKVRRHIVANRALAVGKAALETEDWPTACEHLRTYLFKHPDDLEVLAQYAEASLSVRPQEAKHIRAAVGAYRRLLRQKPGDKEICEKLAQVYFKAGAFNEVAYICRQRLAADPAEPGAMLMLGRALIAQRKNDEAAGVLTRLVQEHPQQVKAFGMLSTLAMEQDAVSAADTALRWLNQAVEANPHSAEARAQRARFHWLVENDVTAAREDLEAAETLPTDDPQVYLLLAGAWLSLADPDRAQAQLEALERIEADALVLHDVDTDEFTLAALWTQGQVMLLQGAGEDGVALADRALAQLLEGRRGRFLPLAIELYVAGRSVERARQCRDEYRRAVEKTSTESTAQSVALAFLDALVATAEGKPHVVINKLEPLLAEMPDSARAWKLLAKAYEMTGQWRRAVEAGEEYLKRAPGDFAVTRWVAELCLRLPDLDEALRYARKAERLEPESLAAGLLRIEIEIGVVEAGSSQPAKLGELARELAGLPASGPEAGQIPLLLARIATLEGRAEEAVAELERASEEGGYRLTAALTLIEHYRNLGRREEAIAVCRRAIGLRGDLAHPRTLLARLQADSGRPADAQQTLEAAVVDLAGREQLEAQLALARFMLRQERRAEGRSLLRDIAAEHADNTEPRVALLLLPEVQEDSRESQRLVDELRVIEGERGLRWRVEQAKLWLRGGELPHRQQEIEAMLTHCTAADPGWSEPAVVLGSMYETLGKDDQAEEAYRRAIDSYPRDTAVGTRLLALLGRQRRFADADSVLARMPADAAVLGAYRVGAAVRRGDFDSAIEELQRQLALAPGDITVRIVLARLIYGYRKDVDTALALLNEAESLGSDFLAVCSAKVGILHAEGRGKEALELLNSEVNRRKDFTAHLLRAQYYAATSRIDLAEEDYTHLAALPGSSADGHLLLGNFYQQRGKTDRAIAAWDAGLEADPRHVELQRRLIEALLMSSEPQKQQRGRAMLSDLLVQLPDDVHLLAVRADILLDEQTPKATQQATAILQRVVQLDPRHVAGHLRLIDLALQRGDLDQASRLLTQALGANRADAKLTLAHALLEAKRNNSRVAKGLAESVLEIDPKNVPARVMLAELALRVGDTDSARGLSDQVLGLDPGNAMGHLLRARALDATGRRNQAIQSLEVYCRTDAGGASIPPLLALAQMYREQGEFGAAEQRIMEAAEIAPDDVDVFLEQLQWLASQDRFDEVLGKLAARRAEYPDEWPVLLAGGLLLASTEVEGHMHHAKSLFEQAVTLAPDRVEGQLGLAQVAYRIGEVDVAEGAYRRILARDPYHRQALNDLAWIIGVDGSKPGEALALADKGVARYPEDPHLLDTRGVLLTDLDRLAAAQRDLENCLKVAADIPVTAAHALLHLGRLHARRGESAKARERLLEAVAIDRQHHVLNGEERAEIDQLLQAPPRSPNERDDVQ